MKLTIITLAALAAALAACGGGSDAEAGSPTALSVVPSAITLTALDPALGGPTKGLCQAGFAGQVFIYGGAGPYRIDNTDPLGVSVDPGTVSGPGGSFNIVTSASCFTNTPIVVVDKLNRQVTVSVTNQPFGSTTTAP